MKLKHHVAATGMSELERQRQANIAKKNEEFAKLQRNLGQQTLILPTRVTTPKSKPAKKRKTSVSQDDLKKETPTPVRVATRQSSRIKGIAPVADSPSHTTVAQEEEVRKRQRISGDQALGDIIVAGSIGKGFFGDMEYLPRGAEPDDKIKQEISVEESEAMEKLSALTLYDGWEPRRIKITPSRIYHMTMHPTVSKPLIFAGDKEGHVGLFDASQKPAHIKDEQDDEDDNDDDPDPIVATYRAHSRCVSCVRTHIATPQILYTGSFDNSIRALDYEKGVSTELYAPSGSGAESAVSWIEMLETDSNVIYFSTIGGEFGRQDKRAKGSADPLYELSEQKIGAFGLHPLAPHYLSTASNDRYMRIWDLRMIRGPKNDRKPELVGEHRSGYSVSQAAFNTAGQVVTSSYDDTLRVFDFKGMESWKQGEKIFGEGELNPDASVWHDCHVGRWVTLMRPQWQAAPQDNIQRFCVSNMNQHIDVYSAKGTRLAHLGRPGEGLITAVPAVATFHPTENWVAGGTASGKLCLWM